MSVEDGPKVFLHLLLVGLGDLDHEVAAAMNQATLAQALVEDQLEGCDQAGCAVTDAEQRRLQVPLSEIAEVLVPGLVALRRAGAEANEHLRALDGHCQNRRPNDPHRVARLSAEVHHALS